MTLVENKTNATKNYFIFLILLGLCLLYVLSSCVRDGQLGFRVFEVGIAKFVFKEFV